MAARGAGAAAGALDLFILTFNCAKNLIDVGPFASHLHAALLWGVDGSGTRTATGLKGAEMLPDLVCLNLQEVAPLSLSFIGSYSLGPYYARFDEALNLAAERILAPIPSAVPNNLTDATTSSSPTSTSSPTVSFPAGTKNTNGGDGASTPAPASPLSERALSFFRPSRRNTGRKDSPYTLVRARNVGMTAILLFARDPARVSRVQEAETSFGAADIGNKGAVGLRVLWEGGRDEEAEEMEGDGEGRRVTELTFVSAHLAAMEWNLKKRNANWRSLVAGLTFANPKSVLAALGPTSAGAGELPEPEGRDSVEQPPADEGHEDSQPLLPASFPRSTSDATSGSPAASAQLSPAQERALHAISIFSPSSHLFVAGDLNYRISASTPPALARFPTFNKNSEDYWPDFLPRDQLAQEKAAGRTLHGLTEADVAFGPSYKFVVLDGADEEDLARAVNEDAVRAGARSGVEGDQTPVVPWKWAGHRWPSWCDRVLYWDVPAWVAGGDDGGNGSGGKKISVKAYNALPVVRSSDHRGVFLRVGVPLLTREELGAPPPAEVLSRDGGAGGEVADPRIRLPVPVDLDAWERRAKARRTELWVGWSMYLWSTRDGAVLIGTVLLVSVVSWWTWRVVF